MVCLYVYTTLLYHLTKACFFMLSFILTHVIILSIVSRLFFALLLPHHLSPSPFSNIFQLSVLKIILCNEEHFSN